MQPDQSVVKCESEGYLVIISWACLIILKGHSISLHEIAKNWPDWIKDRTIKVLKRISI